MGFFDRFRRRMTQPPAGTPAQASAAAAMPEWAPTSPLAAAMKVGVILTGQVDRGVLAVHEAIEAALGKVFGDQVPLAWSREPPGPLALIRAYWVDRASGPYFHFLGWGLTEMGPKASDVTDTSGFGIELSLKVQAFEDERVPTNELMKALKAPLWPVELLSRLAAAVQRSRRPFGHDHWIAAGAASFGPEAIRHLACAHDSSLPSIATPNGAFRYLQIYPIDDAELEQFKQADRAGTVGPVLATRRATDPDLVIARKR